MEQTGTTEQPDRHWDHKLQSTSQSATSPLSGTNTVNQSTNGSIAETVNSMMISVDLECSDSGTYLGFDLSTQQVELFIPNLSIKFKSIN